MQDFTFRERRAQYRQCFDVKDAEDCRYCARLSLNVKSCMDFNSWGDRSELLYQCSSCGDQAYMLRFCSNCINVQSSDYCFECTNSSELFGCIGMRKKKFCILNKQYTEEEYRTLKAKLIEHMKKDWSGARNQSPAGSGTGPEWGEYFPMDLCAFAYNEAFVMDQFPLTKEQVQAKDWRWYEAPEQGESYKGAPVTLPETSAEASDDLIGKILRCEASGKPYKIIPQEMQFYQSMGIPLPRLCPDERHRRRVAKRNPYRLWDRQCAKCKKAIQTTFDPKRPEPVLCTECYLSVVY